MSRIIIFILVLLACITLYLLLYYYTTKRNHYYSNNYPNNTNYYPNNNLDYNYPTNNFNQNSNHLNDNIKIDNKGFDFDLDVDVDMNLDTGINKDNIKGYENEVMYVSDDLKDGSYVNQFKEIDYSKMKLSDNQIGFDPQPRCSSEPLPFVDVNVNYLLNVK